MLDVDARNVAAAQAATPDHPYRRLVARVLEAPDAAAVDADPVAVTSEPGTGDALTELIATLDAQRAYEADASIFDIGKRLAERTLDIER
jgi:hypothetical protein